MLQEELLQYVAVVLVDAAHLAQAEDRLLLQAIVGVDKGRELLSEVNGLFHSYLSCLFFVGLDDIGKGFHIAAILAGKGGIDFKHIGVLSYLRQ